MAQGVCLRCRTKNLVDGASLAGFDCGKCGVALSDVSLGASGSGHAVREDEPERSSFLDWASKNIVGLGGCLLAIGGVMLAVEVDATNKRVRHLEEDARGRRREGVRVEVREPLWPSELSEGPLSSRAGQLGFVPEPDALHTLKSLE